MMLARTQLGFLYQSFSTDRGETWSPAEPSALESPESCPFLTRIPATGDLLAVWNHSRYEPDHPQYGIRRPLSLAISRDDARTWSKSVALETDERYTYAMPVATFNDRWAIFGYYRAHGVQWAGHLQCMINRCRIDDLYRWT
jgi:sialidase-1